jgi:hypothetical protein
VRSNQSQKEDDLGEDADAFLDLVIGSYGSDAISLQKLSTDPSPMNSHLQGRSAMVVVTTMDGDGATVYYPNLETFLDERNDDSRTREKTVPVALEDGRVRPGTLEVTLNG